MSDKPKRKGAAVGADGVIEETVVMSRRNQAVETIILILLGVPVLGLLLGGVYSWPAMRLTKEREPWLSLLLSAGLAATVFGIGCWFRTPVLFLMGAWAFSILLLLVARRFYGGLGHSLERFGVVHASAIVITTFVSAAVRFLNK